MENKQFFEDVDNSNLPRPKEKVLCSWVKVKDFGIHLALRNVNALEKRNSVGRLVRHEGNDIGVKPQAELLYSPHQR